MRKKTKSNSGGYYYSYPDKIIREYMKLPQVSKLEWLEEANEFLYKVTPPKNRKIWEKFRKGEI